MQNNEYEFHVNQCKSEITVQLFKREVNSDTLNSIEKEVITILQPEDIAKIEFFVDKCKKDYSLTNVEIKQTCDLGE